MSVVNINLALRSNVGYRIKSHTRRDKEAMGTVQREASMERNGFSEEKRRWQSSVL